VRGMGVAVRTRTCGACRSGGFVHKALALQHAEAMLLAMATNRAVRIPRCLQLGRGADDELGFARSNALRAADFSEAFSR